MKILLKSLFLRKIHLCGVFETYFKLFFRSKSPFLYPFAISQGATMVINNKLYYVGGNTPSGPTNTVYMYDEANGWTFITTVGPFTSYFALSLIPYNF